MYSAIDSYPVLGIGANGVSGAASGTVIGGPSPQVIEIGGRSLRGAPDWRRQGPPTIFGSQQRDA